jgi:uncharacterized membrane protein YfcA
MLLFIVVCMLVGIFAGFLAGLLGIGGGMIIVPALTLLLPLNGIDNVLVLPMALGTSLSVIILTSLSSSWVHWRQRNILWPVVVSVAPGLILGAATGGYISQFIPAIVLRTLFVAMALFTAAKMWFVQYNNNMVQLPGNFSLALIGLGVGLLASLTGLGGGVLLVPLLIMFNLPLLHAVACSAVCSLLVASVGSISYILAGSHLDVPYSVGFIYLPALFSIASMSMLLAPIGVKYTSVWPVKRIRRLFALVVLAVAFNMIALR